MGCEISSIEMTFKNESHAQAFIAIYNKVMREREVWFENEHLLSEKLLKERGGKYMLYVDAYGVFENPYVIALRYVVRDFILQYPDAECHICYDISWDNSYENRIEVYHYEDGILTVNFQDACSSDDFEDDEDFDDFEDEEIKYCSEIYKYSFCEGVLQLMDGERNIFKK